MEQLQTIKSEDMVNIQSKAIKLSQTGSLKKMLPENEIFKLIDVHRPYYALKDVHVDLNNFATARIEIEQPPGAEVSPITVSEVCRHLAILGSVCCAMMNPVKQKHYYLAHRGAYKRAIEKEYYTGNELTATAECITFNKRMASVNACLLDEQNQLICGIEVSFHIVPYATFERLYSDFYKIKPDFGLANPYTKKNKLFDIKFSDSSASASLGEVKDNFCIGHFPHFPAMPVAIMMNSLLDLAIIYIHHVTGDPSLKMIVMDTTLLADNIGFSGEEVTVHVKLEVRLDNRFRLRCTATSTGGKSVGDITTIIETIKNHSQ